MLTELWNLEWGRANGSWYFAGWIGGHGKIVYDRSLLHLIWTAIKLSRGW